MEELVRTILSSSEPDRAAHYETLYLETLPLIRKIAARYRGVCRRDRSIDEEDLWQIGFFALESAVEVYDPARGSWNQIAAFYIRRAIRAALGIYGEVNEMPDTISLDTHISDESDAALLDLLPDEKLPDIDAAILSREIGALITAALAAMKDQGARKVILSVDMDGMTYEDAARELGVSTRRVRTTRRAGLHELRRNPALKRLADAYALDQRTRFHRHKGVSRFRADWSSTTEDAAIWRIEAGNR